MKLSPRLSALLAQGLDGQDFWDICCDHGLLGRAALRSGRFSEVHFNDQVPHVLAKLRERAGAGLFHLCPAQNLDVELTGTVSIAGVGGFNIIKILSAWDESRILRAERILLNPMTHINELRDFLSVWPRYVESETIRVPEKDRERQILVLTGRSASRLQI